MSITIGHATQCLSLGNLSMDRRAGCGAPFSAGRKPPSLIGSTAAPILPLQREGHSVICKPAALVGSGAKTGTCSLSLSAPLGGFSCLRM